jgi:hypothetical protein
MRGLLAGSASGTGFVIGSAALVGATLVGVTLLARRRGYSGIGGDCVVRCSAGHLFTTIWVPDVSLKSVRLGPWRFQRCPVGDHFALVRPVRDDELSDADRARALAVHDIDLP